MACDLDAEAGLLALGLVPLERGGSGVFVRIQSRVADQREFSIGVRARHGSLEFHGDVVCLRHVREDGGGLTDAVCVQHRRVHLPPHDLRQRRHVPVEQRASLAPDGQVGPCSTCNGVQTVIAGDSRRYMALQSAW